MNWKFDTEVPAPNGACVIVGPEGAMVPAVWAGVGVERGALWAMFRGVAAGDGGKGRDGWFRVLLDDFDMADQYVIRGRAIAAIRGSKGA